MILPEFDNVPAGDHMTASFGIYNADNGGWISYGKYLKERYDEMNEKIKDGNLPKGMSMIDVMKPAQDLYNYCMMKLESTINANS